MRLSDALTLRSVSELVNGRLEHACMPPLGGECEPVGRLVGPDEPITAGDVVMLAADEGAVWCAAQEAYRRGALAVLTARSVNPWAGRSQILVEDPPSAAADVIRWCRRKCRAPAIVWIPCGLERDEVYGCPGSDTSGGVAVLRPRTATQLACHWAGVRQDARAIVVQLNPWNNPETSRISVLCQPEILVITSHAAGAVADAALSDDMILSCLRAACRAIPPRSRVLVGSQAAWLLREYDLVNRENAGAPSSVSGLRESDAALPPGLKRFAG